MSKQKTVDLSDTENVAVTEKTSVVQSELEGISTSIPENEGKEEVVESSAEVVKPVKKVVKFNKVTPTAVKANKKMNVHKFLLYYPQDYYTEALLRLLYPKAIFTVEEWFLRIEEIYNMPTY